eukprot:CAMPEP_0172316378 /NCGR_PEP_ID=MMETSP1058-20130122/27966_1 /TAXON_ID=83371 /ORGANISM="Detonula confervacea, Strain CCMP 353" /LENGTH=516 /DNA_ID=CAMNT_0013030671 /DNA_START=73 /DNA_END=1623 /DNA_ORIENTATION=+
MFPEPPHSLPAGWTAYTDVNTSRTYYVYLPTGDTQWTRPPPPPPPPQLNLPPPPPPQLNPPPLPLPPLPQPMVQNYPTPSYMMTPTTPHSVQCQSQHYSSQVTASNGWNNSEQNYNRNNSEQNYNRTFNQNNLAPPPLTLSTNYNPHWQSKRLRPSSYHDNTDFHQYNPPTKRPCVQHTPSAVIKGNNSASKPETRKRQCSKCGLMRGWDFFSKRQWLAHEPLRKCKACVDETDIAQDAVTIEKEASKLCSSCGEHRACEAFSNRQWSCSDVVRKCKPCVEKFLVAKLQSEKLQSEQATKIQSEQSVDNAIGSAKEDAFSVDANKNRTRTCSSCANYRSWECFSKRQWTSPDDIRKCKSCVDKPKDCAKEVATNRDAVKSQSEQPVDKTIESAKENEVSMNANNPSEYNSQAANDSETKPTHITAVPDAVVSKESQNLIDDNPTNGEDAAAIPLKLCSKCNKELSKCSLTSTQWKTAEGEQQCNRCVIHPILKMKGGSTKNDDRQVIIKQETLEQP